MISCRSVLLISFLFSTFSAESSDTYLAEIDSIITGKVANRTVRAIFRDHEGRLWVGSQSRLDVFTGSERWHGGVEDNRKAGPPWNADIVNIQGGSDDVIYVLTANSGLYALNTAMEAPEPVRLTATNGATALEVDNHGNVWIAEGRYLRRMSVNLATLHISDEVREEYSFQITTNLHRRREGGICFGTEETIRCRDTRGRVVMSYRPQDDRRSVPLAIAQGNLEDPIVIGFSSGHLVGVDAPTGSHNFDVKACGAEKCRITSILSIEDHYLIGTDNGLYVFNKDSKPMLLKPSIHVTRLSQAGNDIWVATDSGVLAFGVSAFQTVNSDSHGIGDEVLSISELPGGNVLVGTYSGAYVVKTNSDAEREAAKISVEGQSDHIRVMASETLGDYVLLGLRQSGIALLPTKERIAAKMPSVALEKATFTVLKSIASGIAFGGTLSGAIFKLEIHNGEIIADEIYKVGALFDSPITSITVLSDRKIIITSERKLVILSNGPDFLTVSKDIRWSTYTGARILSSVEVDDKTIYLGLQNGGLWVADLGDSIVNISPIHIPSLAGTSVFSILNTKDSHLWLSTSRGIFEFDVSSRKTRKFTRYDGLQGDDFNFGAALSHSNGDIYFGGSNGYNRFNPESIYSRSSTVEAFVSRVVVGPSSHALSTRRTENSVVFLRYRDRYIRFYFYTNQYFKDTTSAVRYRLVGFDSEWSLSKSNREATYTSLPSGSYRFELQAASNDGGWVPTQSPIEIKVAPPWWRSHTALAVYFAVSVAVIFGARHYYGTILVSRRATELAREMTATAEQAMEDMQDEVETQARLLENLTRRNVGTLAWISEMLSRQADTLPDELSAELARESLSRIQALACFEHALHYRGDQVLADLHGFTEECAALLCPARRGQSSATVINEVTGKLVDAEHAARLATVIYELLANAIEHGFEGREGGNYVRVALEFDARGEGDAVLATVTVEDNGVGIPTGDPLGAYETAGFALVRDVIAHYSGQLEQRPVTSGTSFMVTLSLPREAVG